MRTPKSPPDIEAIMDVLSKLEGGLNRIVKLTNIASSHLTTHDYPHWDSLRHKPVPATLPEGTTLEEYWYALKINRSATQRSIPFEPKHPEEMGFSFSRPDCLLSELRQIDLKSGGAVTTDQQVIGREAGERYLTRSIIEEPFSSSVLEGAATTREKAQELIEKGQQPKTKDEQMVLNNYRAMMYIKEQAYSDLTPEIIIECHRIVTEKTLNRPEMAGKLRDNNEIVVGDNYGEIFHTPPDFNELPERINALCKFANQSEMNDNPYIHPITKAIILHFMLAYDHPFIDGNGRTARALFYWSVMRSGYWMMEYISISKIIKNAPTQYGMAFLRTETDDNDVTYFILHQLKVIRRAISELELYLDRQKQKYKQIEDILSQETLNHRQTYLLSEIIRKRVKQTSIRQHQNIHNVSYLTARKDLEDLVSGNWLRRQSRGRKYIYTSGPELTKIHSLKGS